MGSHELEDLCYFFSKAHPKIIESTFSFSEFAPACKKSVFSTCSVFEAQSILESCQMTGHTHFWSCPSNKFLISFYCLWVFINMQKVHLFIFQIQSILSPTTWLSMPILDHANPKSFKHLLIYMKLYQHAKTYLIWLVQSWNTVNFRLQRPD